MMKIKGKSKLKMNLNLVYSNQNHHHISSIIAVTLNFPTKHLIRFKEKCKQKQKKTAQTTFISIKMYENTVNNFFGRHTFCVAAFNICSSYTRRRTMTTAAATAAINHQYGCHCNAIFDNHMEDQRPCLNFGQSHSQLESN